MIKLIKNEIIKLLHKKSIYIVLILTALFICFISYMNSYDPSYGVITSFEYNGDDEISKEINKYYKKYNEDDWQYYILDSFINTMSTYFSDKDNIEYKNNYEKEKEAIENNNWKYFVNEKIKQSQEELNNYHEYLKNQSLTKKEINETKASIFQKQTEIDLLNYRLKENVPFGKDYLNIAINNMNNSSFGKYYYEQIKPSKNDYDYEEAVKTYYESEYILKTKEDTNNEQDLRASLMSFMDDYIFLILVFGVMIAGSIVSEEYNKGTIKSLLITPYKRSSILLAKFITVIIMLFAYIIIAYLMDILIGGCFLGFASLKTHVAIYNLSTSSLEVMSIFKYVLLKTIATLPIIILLITLAFSVSTIIGSTPFAIVITFAGYIASSIINSLALYYKIDILKYFVTTNWDFNEYLFGATSKFNISLTHAIIVCIIYFLIMIITSIFVFKNKNIKNV